MRILPSLRRSLFNLEKASEAAPEVSANAVTASQAIAAAAENVKEATGNLAEITGHVAKAARVLRLLSPVGAVADSTTTSVIRVLDIVKGLLLRRRP